LVLSAAREFPHLGALLHDTHELLHGLRTLVGVSHSPEARLGHQISRDGQAMLRCRPQQGATAAGAACAPACWANALGVALSPPLMITGAAILSNAG
jgi:hypothetical protein